MLRLQQMSPELPSPELPTLPSPSALDLRAMTYEDFGELAKSLGERRFRAEQLFRWVHARGAREVAAMTDISRALREQLAGRATLNNLDIDVMQVSVDGTRKLRLRTTDSRLIETVLIPDGDARDPAYAAPLPLAADEAEEGEGDDDGESGDSAPGRRKLTQCISSQVGCAIDCDFCATAKLGFGRHLSASEIVSQVYLADHLLAGLTPEDPTRRAGGGRVTNLVFMGMGEPLHNYDNLVRALKILLHPLGRNFSRRRITVSTAGLVPAIERLAAEPVRVNLAVSLNATTDAQRDVLMPINRKYNLATLLAALRRFPLEKRQRITFEYVLLHGVNDSLEDARRLPALLRGIPCKLNIIPWNAHEGGPYRRPPMEQVYAFQAEAQARGFTVYLRKTRGADIDAACGQLAADNDPRAGRQKRVSLPLAVQ